MNDNKRQEVVRREPAGGSLSFDNFIRGGLIVGGIAVVAILMIVGGLGLLYVAIERSFGPEGIKYVLIATGVLAFIWLALRMVKGVRSDAMKDAISLIEAMTAHDTLIQQSDDRGEIMRQLAPKLIDNATRREGYETQKMITAIQTAFGMFKQQGPQIVDPYGDADIDRLLTDRSVQTDDEAEDVY